MNLAALQLLFCNILTVYLIAGIILCLIGKYLERKSQPQPRYKRGMDIRALPIRRMRTALFAFRKV